MEIDVKKTGKIDLKEVEKACIKFSEKNKIANAQRSDILAALKQFEKNKDSKISLEEFITVLKEAYEPLIEVEKKLLDGHDDEHGTFNLTASVVPVKEKKVVEEKDAAETAEKEKPLSEAEIRKKLAETY